jgi:hypothetical protein
MHRQQPDVLLHSNNHIICATPTCQASHKAPCCGGVQCDTQDSRRHHKPAFLLLTQPKAPPGTAAHPASTHNHKLGQLLGAGVYRYLSFKGCNKWCWDSHSASCRFLTRYGTTPRCDPTAGQTQSPTHHQFHRQCCSAPKCPQQGLGALHRGPGDVRGLHIRPLCSCCGSGARLDDTAWCGC